MAVWNLKSGTLRRRFRGHEDDIQAVAASRDGRVAVSVCLGAKAVVWDLRRRWFAKRLTFRGHTRYLDVVAVSRDGQLALTSSDDKTCVWDTTTGHVVNEWADLRVRHAVFGRDHTRVLIATGMGDIAWLDVPSGRVTESDLHYLLAPDLDERRREARGRCMSLKGVTVRSSTSRRSAWSRASRSTRKPPRPPSLRRAHRRRRISAAASLFDVRLPGRWRSTGER